MLHNFKSGLNGSKTNSQMGVAGSSTPTGLQMDKLGIQSFLQYREPRSELYHSSASPESNGTISFSAMGVVEGSPQYGSLHISPPCFNPPIFNRMPVQRQSTRFRFEQSNSSLTLTPLSAVDATKSLFTSRDTQVDNRSSGLVRNQWPSTSTLTDAQCRNDTSHGYETGTLHPATSTFSVAQGNRVQEDYNREQVAHFSHSSGNCSFISNTVFESINGDGNQRRSDSVIASSSKSLRSTAVSSAHLVSCSTSEQSSSTGSSRHSSRISASSVTSSLSSINSSISTLQPHVFNERLPSNHKENLASPKPKFTMPSPRRGRERYNLRPTRFKNGLEVLSKTGERLVDEWGRPLKDENGEPLLNEYGLYRHYETGNFRVDRFGNKILG